MNPKIVLRIISYLLLIVCAFMLTAVAVALFFNEIAVAKTFFIVIAATVLVTGSFLFWIRSSRHAQPSFKDGFLFVTGSWVIVAVPVLRRPGLRF